MGFPHPLFEQLASVHTLNLSFGGAGVRYSVTGGLVEQAAVHS